MTLGCFVEFLYPTVMDVVPDDIILPEIVANLGFNYDESLSARIREEMFVHTFEIPVVLCILDSLSYRYKSGFLPLFRIFSVIRGYIYE